MKDDAAPVAAQVLTFGETLVQVWPDCVRTILPGGAIVMAAPQDNDAYRATAGHLGYGEDTARMCAEHEAAHTAICAWLGLAESPTLRQVAHGRPDTFISGVEEDVVLALQRFARAAGVDLLQRFG